MALAETNNPLYGMYIGRAICDERLNTVHRQSLLQDWEGEKTADDIDLLYTIAEKNETLAPIAIGLLINYETNIARLSSFLKYILPILKHPFSPRKTPFINPKNLEKLATSIKPWLHNQLLSRSWNEESLRTYLVFVEHIGDISTLDVIDAIRRELVGVIGEEYIERIKHIIRSSGGQIRYPFV